jgi:AcrR family transcriptional regulator
MGAKSEHKKKYIVTKAREVFARKGFKNVTMKDIVDACDISRGGLYLYFSSTQEVFRAVMESEQTPDQDEMLDLAMAGDAPASQVLAVYIRSQKKDIVRRKDSLNLALSEYYSAYPSEDGDNAVSRRVSSTVAAIEKLITDGVVHGEFICDDAYGCARNIALVLEGLRSLSGVTDVTEKMIDQEIVYILKGIIPSEQVVN